MFIDIIKAEFSEDRLTYQKGMTTFHPESAEETARLFRLANEYGQKFYIAGFGNNIEPAGKAFDDIIALRTDRLNEFIKIVPEDFYIVVGAGFPIGEINTKLKKYGLFLPHAELPYAGSVGGALAVGLSGQINGHILPIGRYFIKAEITLPQGRIINPGSICFKSVSGFDIVKIFSPSWGLLGMIAAATFRVLPISLFEEYKELKILPIDYRSFLSIYRESADNISAQYSLKIKGKFDPEEILPPVIIDFH
ncbi:MAG: FAD-binding oxidoreductase [candidate division Zixibacteria bacterium]|nr:FAD-binding oxidoreductase [candidate division Zixibacteria bacterium]